MVLLSGCSMFGGGGDDAPERTVGEAPDHHEFVFGSDARGNDFEATVTVSKDGETVFSERLESDGNGLYANLTTVSEPGPYTVTVNTTLPASGGGNRSEQTTVNGTLGNATAIDVSYQSIDVESFSLPRRDVTKRVSYSKSGEDAETDLRIWYRGELVVNTTFTARDTREVSTVTDLNQTGVYRVSFRSHGDWVNETVVLTKPDEQIQLLMRYNSDSIRVRVPFSERDS